MKISPILSIVIPTYNRANSLDLLLRSISKIDSKTRLKIEVCVSNNNSDDHTEEVISKWKERYQLNSIKQIKNIGGAKNQISALRLATGRWVMIAGDDDAIEYKNIPNLVGMLSKESVNRSIFINPNSKYDGNMSPQRAKQILISTGLSVYGFTGNHIFPTSVLKFLPKFDEDKILGWPHLYMFLKLISKSGVYIYRFNIVNKKMSDVNKECEDWKYVEWVRLIFMRLKIIKYALSKDYFFLSLVLSFKDVFSLQLMANLIYYIVCSKSNNINTLSVVRDYKSGDTTIEHRLTSFVITLIFKGQNILIRMVPFFIYKKILMKIKKIDLIEVCSRDEINKGQFYRGV